MPLGCLGGVTSATRILTATAGACACRYTRNFLTVCKRMLSLEYQFHRGGFLGVEYEGRQVLLQVCGYARRR